MRKALPAPWSQRTPRGGRSEAVKNVEKLRQQQSLPPPIPGDDLEYQQHKHRPPKGGNKGRKAPAAGSLPDERNQFLPQGRSAQQSMDYQQNVLQGDVQEAGRDDTYALGKQFTGVI
jgi:hypothetical protein